MANVAKHKGSRWYLATVLVALSGAAAAEPAPWYVPNEVRSGLGVSDPTTGHETSAVFNAEALWRPIASPATFVLFRPRPHLGVDIDLAGLTSKLYTGLTWELLNTEDWYIDATFGMVVHDGVLKTPVPDEDRKHLGSRFAFREQVEFGYWLSPRYGISVYGDHISNAGWLSRINQGLETAGVRGAVRF